MKIIDQISLAPYIDRDVTVISFDAEIPSKRFSKIRIDDVEYKPMMVYDLPRSYAICASGEFVGKEIHFI